MTEFAFSVEEEIELHQKQQIDSSYHIVLWNDDFNTFDWVIECLIKYCKHDNIQAEQCAWITHYNGKCSIKAGNYEALSPIADSLLLNNLTVTIEAIHP
jgi:ATP-dependent Clp protease adaptor protein ClpS